MRLQHRVVFLGERRGADDQRVGAEQRNGRRDAEPHLLAVERPAVQRGPHRAEHEVGAAVRRRHRRLQVLRQRVEQAGDRLVEGDVGDHRREHGAHAGVEIGLPDRGQFLGRGERHPIGQVVAGGAALQQHLDRAEIGVEILVLERLAVPHLAAAGEQQLERPAVGTTFQEIAQAVGVGIDQPGMHQGAAGVERDGIGRRREAGRADFRDRVADHQYVARVGGARGSIDQLSAADDHALRHRSPLRFPQGWRVQRVCLGRPPGYRHRPSAPAPKSWSVRRTFGQPQAAKWHSACSSFRRETRGAHHVHPDPQRHDPGHGRPARSRAVRAATSISWATGSRRSDRTSRASRPRR